MKVLHVSSYYYPHIGGMEATVAQICKGLVGRGYEVSIYTSRDPQGSAVVERQNGLEVRRFGEIAKPLLNPLALGIFPSILKSDAEIVHAHDEHAFTSNASVAARILRDRPLILHCHGELAPATLLEHAAAGLYDLTLNRASYHIADIVIQVSPAFVPYASRKFGISAKKIRVVPNAIDPSNYSLDADPEVFRMKRNLPVGDWVLYVGTLIRRKGVQRLIDLFPRIIERRPSACLLIVGRGPLKSDLVASVERRKLSGRVFFLEGLDQWELSAAYRLSRLLVLPTFADVAPTVVLEAMLLHRPVVSTNIMGIREFFSNTAQLVEPGDDEALLAGILRLLEDEELSMKKSEAGYQLVSRYFGWRSRVDEVVKIYKSLQ